MKKKNWTLLCICFGISIIIYLFIFLLGTGVVGGVIRRGYEATLWNLDVNTTATIYRLIIDTIILCLLFNLWRSK